MLFLDVKLVLSLSFFPFFPPFLKKYKKTCFIYLEGIGRHYQKHNGKRYII